MRCSSKGILGRIFDIVAPLHCACSMVGRGGGMLGEGEGLDDWRVTQKTPIESEEDKGQRHGAEAAGCPGGLRALQVHEINQY